MPEKNISFILCEKLLANQMTLMSFFKAGMTLKL